MESMCIPWNPYGMTLAEAPAIFSFHNHYGIHMEWTWNGHGMIHSIWIPSPFHMDSIWTGSYGFHVHSIWITCPFHMDSMSIPYGPVHMDSMSIPYGFHVHSIWTSPYGFH